MENVLQKRKSSGLVREQDKVDKDNDDLKILKNSTPKWKNWLLRFIFTMVLIAIYVFTIYGGAPTLMIAILIIQVKCFQEIIDIGYSFYKIHNLPWFRTLSWYFLLTSNYFFYGEGLVEYYELAINRTDYLKFLIVHHRFISFCLYMTGFVLFVLSLVKKYYIKQFSMFAWTHVALLIIVTQSYLSIQNIFQGIIWLVMPVSLVVINDISAYIFGLFFGKTPLIRLSPKKTWEGFIGGGLTTIVSGLILSHVLCQFQYFVCPVEFDEDLGQRITNCVPDKIFKLQDHKILNFEIKFYPFDLHSLALALFSSVIGPFGGFFASGFKRAFKVKDFGESIPGHGGVLDRFDCQYLMATFVNVYITSFITKPSTSKFFKKICYLDPQQQLLLHHMLTTHLKKTGLI